jgi:hypothetical protein
MNSNGVFVFNCQNSGKIPKSRNYSALSGRRQFGRGEVRRTQLEAVLLLRAERNRRDSQKRFFDAFNGLLQSRWGGPSLLTAVVAVAAIALSVAGVDPQMGELYRAASHAWSGCPDVTTPASPPATLAPLP